MERPFGPLNRESEPSGVRIELRVGLGADGAAHGHQALLDQPGAHTARAEALRKQQLIKSHRHRSLRRLVIHTKDHTSGVNYWRFAADW